MPAETPLPVIVIGGGISGLACAWRLKQTGASVVLLDAADRPGGVISTVEKDGFLFERGPQSFLSTPAVLQLIDTLGLKEELLFADPRAPRFILLREKLVAAPLAPPSLLTTPLFGARTKWRLLTEMFRRTRPPAEDESIASFVRRKFGDELLQHLVGPFVSGVYAGDPERLSLRASFPKLYEFESKYGSILRGAMKSRPAQGAPRSGLCSFRQGMETLPKTLALRLGDAYQGQAVVTGVRPRVADGRPAFEVTVTRGNRSEALPAGAVVMAAPASVAAQLLAHVSERLPALFSRIEYAPVAVVGAGYRRDQIRRPAQGFGFLVPRGEGLRVLGTVWTSSLFPGRAPAGMASFTSFAGGATDAELFEKTDAEIENIVRVEIARVLQIEGDPVVTSIHRYTRAIPQYNLGHGETMGAIREIISTIPGLFLAGNYLTGPSIGSCIEQADQVADSVKHCAAYCTA